MKYAYSNRSINSGSYKLICALSCLLGKNCPVEAIIINKRRQNTLFYCVWMYVYKRKGLQGDGGGSDGSVSAGLVVGIFEKKMGYIKNR